MESANPKGVRMILELGKFRVVDRSSASFKVALGGSTTMTITPPIPMDQLDVRDGDILTLYTEVLLAQPGPTSIQ
jgi:hypothetical protein